MMKIVHLQFVIPGRRAAASPESIFQRPVFMDSGPSPAGYPGMTSLVGSRSSVEPPAVSLLEAAGGVVPEDLPGEFAGDARPFEDLVDRVREPALAMLVVLAE